MITKLIRKETKPKISAFCVSKSLGTILRHLCFSCGRCSEHRCSPSSARMGKMLPKRLRGASRLIMELSQSSAVVLSHHGKSQELGHWEALAGLSPFKTHHAFAWRKEPPLWSGESKMFQPILRKQTPVLEPYNARRRGDFKRPPHMPLSLQRKVEKGEGIYPRSHC